MYKKTMMERVAGIEPASSAWKAVTLPLSYTRLRHHTSYTDYYAVLPATYSDLGKWWRGLDSNQRTLTRPDLQSGAFNHSTTPP